MAQGFLVVRGETQDPGYVLDGFVGRIVGGGHDPETWHGPRLHVQFTARNDKAAIEIAQEKVKAFLKLNKKRSRSFYFNLTKTVWGIRYKGPEKGRKALLAVPALSPSEACIEEVTYEVRRFHPIRRD